MVYQDFNRSQERSPDRKSKDIYVFTVVVQSIALDYEGVPEDVQNLTAYFTEYPFDKEIEEWASFWIDCGYEVIDKWRILHQRFDEEKKYLVDIWNPPLEM